MVCMHADIEYWLKRYRYIVARKRRIKKKRPSLSRQKNVRVFFMGLSCDHQYRLSPWGAKIVMDL